jgi:hypothetical protein
MDEIDDIPQLSTDLGFSDDYKCKSSEIGDIQQTTSADY